MGLFIWLGRFWLHTEFTKITTNFCSISFQIFKCDKMHVLNLKEYLFSIRHCSCDVWKNSDFFGFHKNNRSEDGAVFTMPIKSEKGFKLKNETWYREFSLRGSHSWYCDIYQTYNISLKSDWYWYIYLRQNYFCWYFDICQISTFYISMKKEIKSRYIMCHAQVWKLSQK